MVSPVYTKLFWTGSNDNGSLTGPGPPTGKVWVVRDITILCQGVPPALGPSVGVASSAPFPIAYWHQVETEAGTAMYWEGRQVLSPPLALVVSVTAPGASWTISGYELSG